MSACGVSGVTALDLFSGGAGGWSLGLPRAGVRTIAACEADEWRRQAKCHGALDEMKVGDD